MSKIHIRNFAHSVIWFYFLDFGLDFCENERRNSNLGRLTLTNFSVLGNGTKTINQNGTFLQMFFVQGGNGSTYGSYVLSGYGIGTSSRYHAASIENGESISVSIEGTSFVVSNTAPSSAQCALMRIIGNMPTII